MTRSALFNLMLLVLVVCLGVAGLLWWYVQRAELQLVDLQAQLVVKQEELNNLKQMTEAQEKLDALTLDERTTTTLELLKHLGLEKMNIIFNVNSRDVRPTGDTSLITRVVNISLEQPYSEQVDLVDRLYAIGKLHIGLVEMTKGNATDLLDPVALRLEGTLYSLEKQGDMILTSATAPMDAALESEPNPEAPTETTETEGTSPALAPETREEAVEGVSETAVAPQPSSPTEASPPVGGDL